MDCSPPGFSVHGISQARILEWVLLSSSRGSSKPEMEPMPPALQADALLVPASAGDASSILGPGRSRMPTCLRVTKLMGHNYWACSLELGKHNYSVHMPQPLTPAVHLSLCCPTSSAGKESACSAGDLSSTPRSGRKSVGEGISYPLQYSWASLVAQLVKNHPAMWETWVRSLDLEDPLEKGNATHSSILAWRIPWTV